MPSKKMSPSLRNSFSFSSTSGGAKEMNTSKFFLRPLSFRSVIRSLSRSMEPSTSRAPASTVSLLGRMFTSPPSITMSRSSPKGSSRNQVFLPEV